jgi:hypothetical protein
MDCAEITGLMTFGIAAAAAALAFSDLYSSIKPRFNNRFMPIVHPFAPDEQSDLPIVAKHGLPRTIVCE